MQKRSLDMKEKGIKEHPQIASGNFVLTNVLFRESNLFYTYFLEKVNILHLACK